MEGLREVGERAFYSSGLSHLFFPDTVEQIGSEALCFCRELRGSCSRLCLGLLCGSDFSKPLEREPGRGPCVVTGTSGSFTLGWG